MNSITITGRLAQEPELRFAKTGTAMCQVVVPDQKARRLDDGTWENQSATTWFRATVFKEAAEQLAEIAHKGDEVIITGRLITREWTTNDGEARSSLEIDFAKVAVIPAGPKAQRGGEWIGNDGIRRDSQADPWATNGGAASYDQEPPF